MTTQATEVAETDKALVQKSAVSLLKTEAVKERFRSVLGERAPAFISSLMSALHANPELQKCEPWSVISAAAIAASLDLPITPGLGMAHIVPYKGVATFQIGWKGIVQLALRSKEYARINLTDVREGEIVTRDKFTGDMTFRENQDKSAAIIGYLLYFRLHGGYEHWFYLTVEQVLAHAKRYSKTFQRGYGKWVDDFEAMALKTVAKLGLSKFGMLTVDLRRAIETDQAVVGEAGEVVSYPDSIKPEEAAEALMPKEVGQEKAPGLPEQPKESPPEVPAEATRVEGEVLSVEKGGAGRPAHIVLSGGLDLTTFSAKDLAVAMEGKVAQKQVRVDYETVRKQGKKGQEKTYHNVLAITLV